MIPLSCCCYSSNRLPRWHHLTVVKPQTKTRCDRCVHRMSHSSSSYTDVNNIKEIQFARAFLVPCWACSKHWWCQWWEMKGAAPESPNPRGAAPVMERKVHVPFWNSSVLLSRSRMRHSNQPSSSRVSRSTSREAPRVRDTRPAEEGWGWEVKGERVRERERGSAQTHNQTGTVSTSRLRAYHAGDTGIQWHKGHSQSHRIHVSKQNHPHWSSAVAAMFGAGTFMKIMELVGKICS